MVELSALQRDWLRAGRNARAQRRLASQPPAPLRIPERGGGGFALVHVAPLPTRPWRATFFDESGEPWMHTDDENGYAALVARLDGYGLDFLAAEPVSPTDTRS